MTMMLQRLVFFGTCCRIFFLILTFCDAMMMLPSMRIGRSSVCNFCDAFIIIVFLFDKYRILLSIIVKLVCITTVVVFSFFHCWSSTPSFTDHMVTQSVFISNEQLMIVGTVLVLRGRSIIHSMKAEFKQLSLKRFVLGDLTIERLDHHTLRKLCGFVYLKRRARW